MDITTALPDFSSWAPSGSPLPLDMGPYLWVVITGFVLSLALAFGLGANDVANSFATSVGSRVLTLRSACILASIFETAGAVLLGSKVSDTIRKGIFDVSLYEGKTEVLLVGQLAALGGACVWLLVATYFKLPVSGTHSIVGAMIGFHLVVFQTEGVNWAKFSLIIASWFISPLMSGLVSAFIFVLYRKYVLNKEKPLEPGLRVLPVCYALVLLVNVFSITFDGPEMLGMNKFPIWGSFVISLGVGLIVGLVVWFLVVPRLRNKLQGDKREFSPLPEASLEDVKVEPSETFDLNSDLPEKVEPTEPDAIEITALDEKLPAERLEAKVAAANANAEEDAMIVINNGLNVSADTNNTSMQSCDSEQGCFQRFVRQAGWRKIESGSSTPSSLQSGTTTSSAASSSSGTPPKRNLEAWKSVVDPPEVIKLCSPLQILSAVFASFAHGGNDVCNAVGPLVALWSIFRTGGVGQKQTTPVWILFYGGVGMTIGLWILGRRVIETVGNRLTPITPSSGFTIELGAATTVLMASKLGIPISTTHCKVGSVFLIGLVRSRASLEWKVFRNIFLAWVVTLPITAGISAILMLILQQLV